MPYKDIRKKALYQRNYMRTRRAKLKQLKLNSGFVRPKTSMNVRPIDADSQRHSYA